MIIDFIVYINLFTYLIGMVGTFVVSYLVSLLLSKKIDMVSSLKANE